MTADPCPPNRAALGAQHTGQSEPTVWAKLCAEQLAHDSKRFCEISVYMTPEWILEKVQAAVDASTSDMRNSHAALVSENAALKAELFAAKEEAVKHGVDAFKWEREARTLASENARLRLALEEIVEHATKYGAAPLSADKMFSRARAALSKAENAT
jgi:hypothetical protein